MPRFLAFRETTAGELERVLILKFCVSKTAIKTKSALVRDVRFFLESVGLQRLKELLDYDSKTEREEEIVLINKSLDIEFQGPNPQSVLEEQHRLREEILQTLAGLHAMGHKRVSKSLLLEQLCAELDAVNRVLTNLLGQGALKDSGAQGYKLSAKGREIAESMPPQASSPATGRQEADLPAKSSSWSERFDFLFVSDVSAFG